MRKLDRLPDGRTYTFAIKDGLTYTAAKGTATDYSITAEDFVFAFRRIFQAQTGSPYAVEFSAIENSAAVLDGTADPSTLGVSASGPLTLVFRLSEKDDNFLAKLTPARCHALRRGVLQQHPRHLRPDGKDHPFQRQFLSVQLDRQRPVPAARCLCAPDRQPASGAEHRQHRQECRSAHRGREMLCRAGRHRRSDRAAGCFLPDTTWALLFNSAEGSVFENQALRQALAGIARENAAVPSSGLYTAAEGLVPAGLTVDGIAYRDTAGDPMPVIPDPRALYLEARQGMASSDFSGVTILLPKEAGLTELAEQINGAWQKDCSLFFSVEEVPQEEFDKRLAAGDYTIALAPHLCRGRQRIPDASAVHCRGRWFDRLL